MNVDNKSLVYFFNELSEKIENNKLSKEELHACSLFYFNYNLLNVNDKKFNPMSYIGLSYYLSQITNQD